MNSVAFVCRGIRDSQNTAQYQRGNILTEEYVVYFIMESSKNNLPKDLCERSAGIYTYPSAFPNISMLFSLWALATILYINLRNGIDFVYTTNAPRFIISGYLSQLMGFLWVSGIYDHPLLGVDIAISRGIKKRYNIYNVINAKLVKIAFHSPPDLLILALHKDILYSSDIFPCENDINLLNVYNGVDLNLIEDIRSDFSCSNTENKNSFLISYIGPVQESRSISTIIECGDMLNKRNIEFQMRLIGPVTNRSEITEQISDDVSNRINIVGEVDHNKALEEIYHSDVCLCTLGKLDNHKYSYPIKLFEYMAFGKPVVATDFLGTSSIIDNEQNGILIEQGDANQLATELIRLNKNDQLRRSLGEQAMDDIKKYDWEKINNKVIKHIDEMDIT